MATRSDSGKSVTVWTVVAGSAVAPTHDRYTQIRSQSRLTLADHHIRPCSLFRSVLGRRKGKKKEKSLIVSKFRAITPVHYQTNGLYTSIYDNKARNTGYGERLKQ